MRRSAQCGCARVILGSAHVTWSSPSLRLVPGRSCQATEPSRRLLPRSPTRGGPQSSNQRGGQPTCPPNASAASASRSQCLLGGVRAGTNATVKPSGWQCPGTVGSPPLPACAGTALLTPSLHRQAVHCGGSHSVLAAHVRADQSSPQNSVGEPASACCRNAMSRFRYWPSGTVHRAGSL